MFARSVMAVLDTRLSGSPESLNTVIVGFGPAIHAVGPAQAAKSASGFR